MARQSPARLTMEFLLVESRTNAHYSGWNARSGVLKRSMTVHHFPTRGRGQGEGVPWSMYALSRPTPFHRWCDMANLDLPMQPPVSVAQLAPSLVGDERPVSAPRPVFAARNAHRPPRRGVESGSSSR